MFRADPVGMGLVVFGPLLLAAVQLTNSLVNDLSLAVSVPFAVLLVAFSGVLTRYQLARYRRMELEAAFAAGSFSHLAD